MNAYEPIHSALIDYPGCQVPRQPTVAVAIPVYNESKGIRQVLAAIAAQDYPQLTQIYVIDGASTDNTKQLVQEAQQADQRITLLHNPKRNQAAALNLAFCKAKTDIVMRLDAHATYAPDVVRRSVESLLATGAGGVGAIARTQPATTVVGQSIVAAHASKLGVGAAAFRQEDASGWVDTVWNGCYWRYIVEQVGLLREDLLRTEDNDFHARLCVLGYGLYLEPAVVAYYQPRQTLGTLWQQYWQNGLGIAQTLVTHRQAVQFRHLMPGLFVAALLGLSGCALFWSAATTLFLLLLLLYASALFGFTIEAWRKRRGRHLFLLPLVFMTLHVSYGLGTLYGFVGYGFQRALEIAQHLFVDQQKRSIS